MAEWDHLAEESSFVGRTGSLGDVLGSKIEATRLIQHIIRLTFLLNKKFTPYPKWRSTVFSQLSTAKYLKPILLRILKEEDWRKREKLLCDAYLILLEKQNSLKFLPHISLKPGPFFSRDQIVIKINKITSELKKLLRPPLTKIKYPIGSIDHFIDDTHLLTDIKFTKKMFSLSDNL